MVIKSALCSFCPHQREMKKIALAGCSFCFLSVFILFSSFGQIQAFFNNGLLAFNNASHHQHLLSNHLHIFLFSYITDINAYVEQFCILQ